MTQPSSVIYYPGYSQEQVQYNYLTQIIASISNSNPMVLNTENDSNYLPGMIVTFLIPSAFGMQQLNGINGQVLAVSGTQLTININALNFTAFAYPSPLPFAYTPPSIVPQGTGQQIPTQLPYGNQNFFDGTIFNNGTPGNPVNGM